MAAVKSRVRRRGQVADLAGVVPEPVELWYFTHSAIASNIFWNSVPGRHDFGTAQTINTGTPGFYDGLESSNFQGSNEVRRDGTNQPSFYPVTIAAFVRPRNLTQLHVACSSLDSSSDGKFLFVAARGDVAGDPVQAFHHNYGGASSITANTTKAFIADGWHTVAAVFTKSGSTITTTVKAVFSDGVYEEVSATNSAADFNGHDRFSVGALSDTTPTNTGNQDVVWAGWWRTALTRENLIFLHNNPGFLQPTPPPLRTFSTATVTALPSPRAEIGTALASFDRVLHAPWPDWHDKDEHLRQHAEVIEGVLEGGLRSVGIVTLTANSATTVVEERRCGTASVISLCPVTESAGGEVGVWISNIGARNANNLPSFTINHGTDARTDRTFRYIVIGASGSYASRG